jgi:hypothetical protein
VLSVPNIVHAVGEVSLHYPMIRKQLAGRFIAPGVGQLRVLGSVLHILVAHPVLHKAEFTAGIEEVGGDGMLETMELAFLRGHTCLLPVSIHRALQGAPVKGYAPVGDEQIG